MMYKKVMASALLWAALTASAGAFDYNQSVDEIAESPLTAYQTVYLGMPRADFDANFSILPDWTFYGSSVSFTERAERTSRTYRSRKALKSFRPTRRPRARSWLSTITSRRPTRRRPRVFIPAWSPRFIPIWKISRSNRPAKKWNGPRMTYRLPSLLTAKRTATGTISSISGATTTRY